MSRNFARFLSGVAIILGASAGAAYADASQTTVEIEYRIDWTSRLSPVSYRVYLQMEAVTTAANSVAWQITAAEFTDPVNGWSWVTGAIDNLASPDGLWHVNHADPANPEASEFVHLPSIEGVAQSEQLDTEDLYYSITEGQNILAGGETPFGNQTAFSTHSFWIQNEEDPEDDGEDEPVVIIDRPKLI